MSRGVAGLSPGTGAVTSAGALAGPVTGAGFDAALARLVRQVHLQCDLEDRRLLPVLGAALDVSQRAMMAFEAEALLAGILGDRPVEDAERMQPATALIEEAQVVLGSLPAPDPVDDSRD